LFLSSQFSIASSSKVLCSGTSWSVERISVFLLIAIYN